MEKDDRPLSLFTRREFLLGTASLALAAALPACSQPAKIVLNETAEPEIPARF